MMAAINSASPMVQTALGLVAGRASGGAEAFLGLPYAKAPVGARRFAPALVYDEPWDGVFNASNYGAPCHQSGGVWDEDPGEHPQVAPFVPAPSEDCLFVNVWRPKQPMAAPPTTDDSLGGGGGAAAAPPSSARTLLPVMVWIHGGGFCGGAGSVKWYDGTSLASTEGIVVVSLNYRLGPLGFLASPTFQKRYGATGGANGVNDQRTALQWVKAHIASFGGDPDRVTVYGESSGGISVCLLNASPKASGLFHQAIISSGPCVVPSKGWGPHTTDYAFKLTDTLLKILNASSVDDLMTLPPQLLQWDNTTLGSDNFAGYSFDGGIIDAWPIERYKSGALNAQRLLIGHTSKDGTAPFYGKSPLANATAAEWHTAMQDRWAKDADRVRARYPLSRYASAGVPAVTASYIESDADERVACPLNRMATLAANASKAGGGKSVFSFVYSHLHLKCDPAFEMDVLPPSGSHGQFAGADWASHGQDVKFVFNTNHGCDSLQNPPFPRQDCPFDASEADLASFMGTSWASFVKTGTPSWAPFADTSVGSPAAAASTTRTMRLCTSQEQGGRAVVNDYKADDCAFWDQLEPYARGP